MRQLLFLLPFITQWSFFQNGEIVLTADETQLDSITVDMRLIEDLSFDIRLTDGSLTITPSDLNRTYMWQLTDRNSLNMMAQWVGRNQITPEEFWQYYIYLFFDPRYDLDCGVTELDFDELGISAGTYEAVIAGCDSLGRRTSDFTRRRLRIPSSAYSPAQDDTSPGIDTLYYFMLWKDGKQVAELPSTSVDSIKVSEIPQPVSFDLSVTDIGKTKATISVSPSYPVPYYFDYVPASVFNTYPDDATFASHYIAFLKSTHSDFDEILSYEPDSYTFTEKEGLDSGTDYYAFAVAINLEDTTYIPSLARQPFTTWEQSFIEGFTFDFEYLSATNRVQITPSIDTATYVWSIWSEGEVNARYGGSPERAWKENASITAGLGFIDKGVSYANLTYECMWPGKYYLTVAGYDKGQTSPVFVYPVTVVE